MAKDPAFLFYSKDFYEGTRTLLPEERACYIDLLIYQHQNGFIPNDIRRLLLYCSGVDEATLEATLKAKFKLTDKGYVNTKLEHVVAERKTFTDKQSVNGQVGQFFKKAKRQLKVKQYNQLREYFDSYSNEEKLNIIQKYEVNNKGSLEAMLEAMLKHLAIANENENENIESISKVKNENLLKAKQFKPPSLDEMKAYFTENGYPTELAERAYNYYSEFDWKDRNGNPVLAWKQKMHGTWFKPENKPSLNGGTSKQKSNAEQLAQW